ncbi:DUF4157 domain-containing protein [Mesorhizobium sp. M1348]|uniref:eCIS core domain-containing protein n=1 Tax=unclassified Mesorhizobium TaxID=325217 RepID=UPI0033399A50
MSACAQSAMQRKPTAAHKHVGGALRRSGVKAECECKECAKKKGVLQRAAVNEYGGDLIENLLHPLQERPPGWSVRKAEEVSQGPLGEYTSTDVDELAAVMLGEDRKSEQGRTAVAWVAIGRALKNYNNYGTSLHAQLSKKVKRKGKWVRQFMGFTDKTMGFLSDPKMKSEVDDARALAKRILSGREQNPVGDRLEFRSAETTTLEDKVDHVQLGGNVFFLRIDKSKNRRKNTPKKQIRQPGIENKRLGEETSEAERYPEERIADLETGGLMQRSAAGGTEPEGEVPDIVYDVLRSSGQPLDRGTREFMEERFNHDFSAVRIHKDDRAAESARAVNARAYTVGTDIAFGRGYYSPSTFGGRKLIAHELSHVVLDRSSARAATARRKIDDGAAKNKGKKVIRVALTIDDGPQKNTPGMRDAIETALRQKGPLPYQSLNGTTWFIQRDRIMKGGVIDAGKLKQLKEIQDKGGEIAIHSFSKTRNHKPWFPITEDRDYSYQSVEDAIDDLRSFRDDLSKAGIRVRFVRMPGGLVSERKSYLSKLNKSKPRESEINKNKVKSYENNLMKSVEGDGFIYKDWSPRGESSGDLGRVDTVTGVASNDWAVGVKNNFKGKKPTADKIRDMKKLSENPEFGAFEVAVRGLKDGESTNFVVLSHDNSERDVAALSEDINRMVQYAKFKNVEVEFVTLTEMHIRESLDQKNTSEFLLPLLHPKLVIGDIDDPAERMADALAHRVMSASPSRGDEPSTGGK